MARILLIEGDEEVRSSLRSILKDAEHEVWEASDGNTGIVLFHQHAVQVIIIALGWDVRPGLSFIQDSAYLYPRIEIIALLDPAAERAEVYARTFGASVVFVKPVNPGALLNTIQELIDEE